MIYHCYFVLAVAMTSTYGLPDGSPVTSCVDMMVRHPNVVAQASAIPYTLTVSKNTIKPSEIIEVAITGNTPGETIKGLFVQARVDNKPVGEFVVALTDNSLHTVSCSEPNSAITHMTTLDDKSNRVNFTWKAPLGLKGKVTFRYTIAKNYAIFWNPADGPTVIVA